MRLEVIVVGTLKERYWKDGVAEYTKRLGAYAQVHIREITEERLSTEPTSAQVAQALEKEAQRIEAALPKSGTVIALCIEGKTYSSPELASALQQWFVAGGGTVSLLIGSSYGLAPSLKQKANVQLSFSELTFPHQLMRLILLEQLYRAFRILNHEPYHK
uniref:23S rRNA (pseudouridine(1915)-N(3))-methyltransferase RlmH n=1 Tax=Ndongobacter massiliensis TaxID=1871025 RepID=UPI000931DB22|nr:23S rRNA (pseudouridine(1915)-N(3))-methyltransferase RlmH [Ndongobacter massiliensis]